MLATSGPTLHRITGKPTHHLGIGTRDLHTGVQTGTVVSLDDVTLHNLAGTHTTVVRTLRGGETVLGPGIQSASVSHRSKIHVGGSTYQP